MNKIKKFIAYVHLEVMVLWILFKVGIVIGIEDVKGLLK